MKYLVLIAIVLVVIWFMRSGRRDAPGPNRDERQRPLAPPEDMVRCDVCSLHLPRADALPGPDGHWYCSEDHRRRAGA